MNRKSIKIIILFSILISIFFGKKIFYYNSQEKREIAKSAPKSSPQKNDQIVVAVSNSEYYPFEYYDKNTGKMIGLDIDLAEKISAKAKKTLTIKLIPFSKIISAVHKGEVDMAISAISPDDERAKLVNFSKFYYSSPFVIVFKRSRNAYSFEKLEGKKVGVEEGTSMALYSKNYIHDRGISLEIIEFKTSKQMIKSLENDKIDAIIIEEAPALKEVISKPELNLSVQKIPDTAGGYAIAIRKDWEEGLKLSNETINELFASGNMDRMYEKYGISSLITGK